MVVATTTGARGPSHRLSTRHWAGQRRGMGSIEDTGQAALFLASDAADYIAGTPVRVDDDFKAGLRLPTL